MIAQYYGRITNTHIFYNNPMGRFVLASGFFLPAFLAMKQSKTCFTVLKHCFTFTSIVEYVDDTTLLVKVCKNEIDLLKRLSVSFSVGPKIMSWHVIPKNAMN